MRKLILILIVLTLGVMMSLWDVDKNSNNRISPQLNQSDQIVQRVSNATTSVNPVTDATTTSGFLKTANGQILGNNGTNNVGLFGFDDTGTMVVKVAKPGYDANSATNDQLIFNSAQNTFKIALTDTVVLTRDASDSFNGVSYQHNLGFKPVCIAFIDYGGITLPMPKLYFNGTSGILDEQVQIQDISTSVITFDATAPTGGSRYASAQTYTIRFYLLQETAN